MRMKTSGVHVEAPAENETEKDDVATCPSHRQLPTLANGCNSDYSDARHSVPESPEFAQRSKSRHPVQKFPDEHPLANADVSAIYTEGLSIHELSEASTGVTGSMLTSVMVEIASSEESLTIAHEATNGTTQPTTPTDVMVSDFGPPKRAPEPSVSYKRRSPRLRLDVQQSSNVSTGTCVNWPDSTEEEHDHDDSAESSTSRRISHDRVRFRGRSEHHGSLSESVTTGIRRLANFGERLLGAGVGWHGSGDGDSVSSWSSAEEEVDRCPMTSEDYEHDALGGEHVTPEATRANAGVNVDELLVAARSVFRAVLVEVPDVERLTQIACEGKGTPDSEFQLASLRTMLGPSDVCSRIASRNAITGADCAPGHVKKQSIGPFDNVSPLYKAMLRSRIVNFLIQCCESTAEMLSGDEESIWWAFVTADVNLCGSLKVPSEAAQKVVEQFPNLDESRKGACGDELAQRAYDGEVDFVDVLSVLEQERNRAYEQPPPWRINIFSGLRGSIASTGAALISHALGAAQSVGSTSAADKTEDSYNTVRAQCAYLSTAKLISAAAAYQRNLVLLTCWICEQTLRDMIEQALMDTPSSEHPSGTDKCRDSVTALLAVLHLIWDELSLNERALWELAASQDRDFDGFLTRSEVNAFVDELECMEDDLSPTSAGSRFKPMEIEELCVVRAKCQKRAVDALFETASKEKVAAGGGHKLVKVVDMADIWKWWLDMSQEIREAACLVLPLSFVERVADRQPEDMFRTKLLRASADTTFARTALAGHARVFSSLRALELRRVIEGHQSSSPSESRGSSVETD